MNIFGCLTIMIKVIKHDEGITSDRSSAFGAGK